MAERSIALRRDTVQDDLITAEELGARLRLKPDTVILWARQGRIPVRRLSRKVVRFRLPEVVAALEAATTNCPVPHPVPGSGA